MTSEASRLTVLAITAPHPSWKALAITFKLVPGGPEAIINGLGSLSPSTVIERVGILLFPSLSQSGKSILRQFCREFQAARHESFIVARNAISASSPFLFSLPAVTLGNILICQCTGLCQIPGLTWSALRGDGGIPGISTTYAESKTNGCRAQRTTRTDGRREWSATGSFHRNLESRPRLASRKAAIIASRYSLRPCRQCLGHIQRKIRAITVDRWSH